MRTGSSDERNSCFSLPPYTMDQVMTAPLSPPRRPTAITSPAALKRLGLPLGFPLPPLTVPRKQSSLSMASDVQTKEVEYYRAAGAHSIDLERVPPQAIAPLAINKRTRQPPAAIVLPSSSARSEIVRPPRSPARPPSISYSDLSLANPPPHPGPKTNRGPAPGPPPLGPLPPLPDGEVPFAAADPLVQRAVSARERREARRQSKLPDDKDIAALERSMRRLSRISVGTAPATPEERPSEPTSPTASLSPSSITRLDPPFVPRTGAERAEKLLRRISRQSDTVRLPSDYGRVGISGYSAPVTPALHGTPAPPRPVVEEESELAYLVEKRPSPALSVPMRRTSERNSSSSGSYLSTQEPTNTLGLGLGLTLAPSDSTSTASLSTLPSDATITSLPSESTIRASAMSRPARLGSLSSASSTTASFHSTQTFETASSTSLLTPISPPALNKPLPQPPRSPMSPPRPLKLKATIRIPSRAPSPDVQSILARFQDTAPMISERPRISPDVSLPTPVHDERYSPIIERPSLEAQSTPRVAHANRSAAPTPTPKTHKLISRPSSPNIADIIRSTPRPTRRGSQQSFASSTATSRRPSCIAPPSSFRRDAGTPGPSRRGSEMSMTSSRRSSSAVTASSAGLDAQGAGPEQFFGEQYDSNDSDSDLDLCTPLPHMMLRAGLLSPRSTIIAELMEAPAGRDNPSGLSARGEALRLKGEKVWKAESRRKVRHRDGRNLRDGVGLTTGLGWSDSEDEDAPSPLRRRLSSVLMAKAQSRPGSQLSRHTTLPLSRRSTYSNLDSASVSSQSLPRTPSSHPLSLPLTPSSLPGGSSGTDDVDKLDFPLPPTATNWRPQAGPSLRKYSSNSVLRSAPPSTTSGAPPTPATSSRTRSTSATSSATRTPSRSKMPAPTPRPSRILRAPSNTRLSAPEALRQADAFVSDGTRRLSGA